MIKFRIHPKIYEEEKCKFGKVLRQCYRLKNYRFFDIFWDILDKMKDNLCQECVKEFFYPFRAKMGQLPMTSQENDSFSSFDPTFLPVPP